MRRQHNNYGRDQNIIGTVQGDFHVHEAPSPTRSDEEQQLLAAVEDEVESRLAKSLHKSVLINLAKDSQPERVSFQPYQEVRIGKKPATPLPLDHTIAQVFDDDDINGKLLILGQPGAGKTTALLELADVLLQRARRDVNASIPVIVNLSSWQDEKQSIGDWLIERLRSQFKVCKNLASKWISDRRRLLPLLDGLDEVAPERQEACAARINEFLAGEASPLKLVVCSRLEEYDNLHLPLDLRGAVCLKELTNEQIQKYLNGLNRPRLWQVISESEGLLALMRSPFLLNITILAYPQDSDSQLGQLGNGSKPLQSLLDAYVEPRLDHQFGSRFYSKRGVPKSRKTKRWLVWLARQMKAQSQTEFLIEEMQPSMLPARQRWMYPLAGTLIGVLIITPIFGPIFGPIISTEYPGLTGWLTAAFAGGMVGWTMFTGNYEIKGGLAIQPVETLKWSWQNVIEGLNRKLMVGLALGLLALGMTWLLDHSLSLGLWMGTAFSLIYWLSILADGVSFKSIERKIHPNQGIKRSAKRFWIVGLTSGLFTGITIGLWIGLLDGLFDGLLGGLACGLLIGLCLGSIFGGITCLQHFTLRLLLYWNKSVPWDYARFLNYCTERLLLQRVGGRYRFIHKHLQDYFSDL